MYKILSIDWDFFLNCPIELRRNFEPYSDEVEQWSTIYKKFKCLKSIPSINNDDYKFIIDFVNSQNCSNIYISNSHEVLYDLIINELLAEKYSEEEISDNINLDITNIDFHHDCYHSILGSTPLNCASWLSCLYERHNFDINSLWIGHNNSYDFWDVFCIDQYSTNIKDIKKHQYDMIFICKSKEYMPPHLDNWFIEMVNKLNKNKTYLEQGILQNRLNRYK